MKICVGAGYEHAVVPKEDIVGIKIQNTYKVVNCDGEFYPLYKGLTFDDSQKIDILLDSGLYKIYR